MNEGEKTTNPNEVETKKQQALQKLQVLGETYKKELSPAALKGMEMAIEQYYGKEKEYAQSEFKRGGNALNYLDYKNTKGKGLTNVSEIYDIDMAIGSNINMDQLYKMFAPQVVENILQNKPVVFPETWDIGAHYTDKDMVAKHVRMTPSSSNRIVIAGNEASTFRNSMKDRIDLLANNSTSEDIGNMFSIQNQDKFKNNLTDAEYLAVSLNGQLLPSEKQAATAFNNLLSKATGGGRNLGGDIYADTAGNIKQGMKFQKDTSRITDQASYDLGYGAISGLNMDKPVNEQITNLYTRTVNARNQNADSKASFMEGVYTKLAEQNENIIRIDGVPQRVKRGQVSQLYKQQIAKQAANSISGVMSDIGMSVETKQLFDRYRYLSNVVGDPYGVEDQIGRLWIPN